MKQHPPLFLVYEGRLHCVTLERCVKRTRYLPLEIWQQGRPTSTTPPLHWLYNSHISTATMATSSASKVDVAHSVNTRASWQAQTTRGREGEVASALWRQRQLLKALEWLIFCVTRVASWMALWDIWSMSIWAYEYEYDSLENTSSFECNSRDLISWIGACKGFLIHIRTVRARPAERALDKETLRTCGSGFGRGSRGAWCRRRMTSGAHSWGRQR